MPLVYERTGELPESIRFSTDKSVEKRNIPDSRRGQIVNGIN